MPVSTEAADECGVLERDLLGDAAAEGEADQVDALMAERADERCGVGGHLGHRVRDFPAASADPAVVEGDDVVAGGDPVDHARVPVVEHGGEVVQEHNGVPSRGPSSR